MAEIRKPRTPLRWTWYGGHKPVWPREPDVAAIKSLAIRHLQTEIPTAIEDALLDVSFFAEGGFNKLYQITYSGHQPSYLLRVALPVDPYVKTESEVATIAFVHANTTVPVPRIIAWQSNCDVELGFEWILMDKIPGVPLYEVWRKVPWEQKLTLVEILAGFIKEIQGYKFDSIGAIYFKSALVDIEEKRRNAMSRNFSEKDVTTGNTDTMAQDEFADLLGQLSSFTEIQLLFLKAQVQKQIEALKLERETSVNEPRGQLTAADHLSEDEFAIGQHLDGLLCMRSRLYVSADRGPYLNQRQWLSGLIRAQMEWVKKAQVPGEVDYEEELEEEGPAVISLCKEYLEVLPAIFGTEDDDPSYVLYHSDVNLANILVDPETFDIIGVVDWERLNVVPMWKAIEYPKFMIDMEPMEQEEPPIPSYEDEEDISVYVRDRWDNRLLRHHWDRTMQNLHGAPEGSTLMDAGERKSRMEFEQEIWKLSENFTWAQSWMKEYKAKKDGLVIEEKIPETS